MDIKRSMMVVVCSTIIAGAFTLPSVANAAGTQKYKISMKRANPSEPISRDGILSAVERKYGSRIARILSVQEKQSPAEPDCHVVRALATDKELMTIHVACSG